MNLTRTFGLHEASCQKIEVLSQDSLAVREFRTSVSQLRKLVGDSADVTLENFLYQTSVANFELYFNPTPYEFNGNLQSLLQEILSITPRIRNSVDDQSNECISKIEMLCNLIQNGENNSLFVGFEKILYVRESSDEILIIVKNGRIRKSFQEYLLQNHSQNIVKVVLPGEVPGLQESFDTCVIFGDPEAFEGIERFVCAINSMNVRIITFGTQLKSILGLFSDLAEISVKREFAIKSGVVDTTNLTLTKQELDLYLGRIENRYIESTIRNEIEGIAEFQGDNLECYAFALAGDHLFFIPVPQNEDNRVMVEVLRPDESLGQRVQRVEVAEIDANSIVLTRRGHTATAAIIPLANEIMGAASVEHRGNQSLWKERLRERIQTLGTDKVRNDLKQLGIKNPYVSSWHKQDTMRPKSDGTFAILLEYLDFPEGPRAVLFSSARIVNSAHIAAGHEFLKRLKEAFEDVPASQIYGEGIVDKNISADGKVATLSAIVCLGRLDGTREIPEELIRRPILLSRGVTDGKSNSKFL